MLSGCHRVCAQRMRWRHLRAAHLARNDSERFLGLLNPTADGFHSVQLIAAAKPAQCNTPGTRNSRVSDEACGVRACTACKHSMVGRALIAGSNQPWAGTRALVLADPAAWMTWLALGSLAVRWRVHFARLAQRNRKPRYHFGETAQRPLCELRALCSHLAERPTPSHCVVHSLRTVVPTPLFVCVVRSHYDETATALLPVKSATAAGGANDEPRAFQTEESVYTGGRRESGGNQRADLPSGVQQGLGGGIRSARGRAVRTA